MDKIPKYVHESLTNPFIVSLVITIAMLVIFYTFTEVEDFNLTKLLFYGYLGSLGIFYVYQYNQEKLNELKNAEVPETINIESNLMPNIESREPVQSARETYTGNNEIASEINDEETII